MKLSSHNFLTESILQLVFTDPCTSIDLIKLEGKQNSQSHQLDFQSISTKRHRVSQNTTFNVQIDEDCTFVVIIFQEINGTSFNQSYYFPKLNGVKDFVHEQIEQTNEHERAVTINGLKNENIHGKYFIKSDVVQP